MNTINEDTLYDRLVDEAPLIRRVGLREALATLEPTLRDRTQAKCAVRAVYALASKHRESVSSQERAQATFLSSEAIDAAYQLRIHHPELAVN